MKSKVLALTTICALISTPAIAFTEPYPGSYRETRDITCPAQYPVKTGESTMAGGYITTCWTSQAWSLQMAGGDDWTAWLNGTYTPAPVVIERVITVSGGTTEVIRLVPAPEPDLSTTKAIKKRIKQLKTEIKRLERRLKQVSRS